MAEVSTCARISQVLFIIIQVFFFILGSCALGLGIYLLVTGDQFGEELTGSSYLSGGALLVVCGGVSWILTILGCVGALGLWRPLLGIYVGLIAIVVILEIVAGILGFVYRDDIENTIATRMEDLISRVRKAGESDFSEAVNDAVEFVEERFQCCGANNATDYERLNPEFFTFLGMCRPSTSCFCSLNQTGCRMYQILNETDCSPPVMNYTAWGEGCIDGTRDELLIIGYSLGGVGVAFGIVEILAIILALILICTITSSKKDLFV